MPEPVSDPGDPGPVRVLVVQHGDDGPPARLGGWLEAAGATLDVRHPYAGDPLPAGLGDHDAVLVLGGAMGSGEDTAYPWLAATKGLVREAAATGTPTLGVCLGHQLCAVALGGRVERNPRGQQLGLVDVGWRPAADGDPLVAPLVGRPEGGRQGVHWNDDVVVELPAGATVLATAPGGEVQVARFAGSVWGVQLHPEADAALIRPWAEDEGDRYPPAHLAGVLARVDDAHDRLGKAWQPLAETLLSLARERRAHP